MAKVIVWNLLTLDGFFEGETKWDLAFHGRAWGPELEAMANEFGDKAAILVFGRVTYEGMRDYWTAAEPSIVTTYMNGLPKLAASRTLSTADWNNTVISADIEGEIARRRQEPGKDIYIFGSADMTDSLLKAGLIDEMMLCLVPVTLGKGTPFFKGSARNFDLIEARSLSNGCTILRYKPEVSAA